MFYDYFEFLQLYASYVIVIVLRTLILSHSHLKFCYAHVTIRLVLKDVFFSSKTLYDALCLIRHYGAF